MHRTHRPRAAHAAARIDPRAVAMAAATGTVAAALALASPSAQAGRPLASDDAGAADFLSCQIEAWGEKAGTDRATVIAPACGIAPGLELGADYTLPRPRDPIRSEAGLALKYAPEGWKLDLGGHELRFGLKLAGAWARPVDARWQGTGSSALGLASLSLGEPFAVHLNLGVARDRASRETATVANLALVWTPAEPLLLFAETQANNRRDTFGGTVNSVGARWWLVKETLGLDFSASREAVTGAKTSYTLGLGWYGLKF